MRKRTSLIVVAMALFCSLPHLSAAEPYPLRPAVEHTVRGGLPNVLAKLKAGKHVRIAYLGGSITAQAGWRPLTLGWFQKQFPGAKIDEINAAIGGTGSDLGVFRLAHDVLQHKPDLLFVEFAVNDGGAAPDRIHRAMEGILRQTLANDPSTDICYVYTLTQNMLRDLQGGKYPRAASAMEALADHYQIPSIHMGLQVARLEKAGKVVFKAPKPKSDQEKKALEGKILFSPDGVHPYNDSGHQLYLDAVVRAMGKIRGVGKVGPHTLPAPFVADNWQRAKLIPLSDVTLSDGWQKLTDKHTLARRFGKRLGELWKTNKAGATISVKFKGTMVGVYDLLGPDCGQVIVKLDDRPLSVRRRFDGYCTYHRLAMMTAGTGLADGPHRLVLTLHEDQPDKRNILHKHRQGDLAKNPSKYNDRAWYVGAIMLIGDIERSE